MKLKEYNNCGDLTGRERELCNAALTNYVTLAEISSLHLDENFSNAQKIIDWSNYNLNEIERRASINFNSTEFETLTPLQIGLFKYFLHLLYENRYNISYNRLVNFCDEEKIVVTDDVERLLDRAAQECDYFTSFMVLTENFRWTLTGGRN